MLAPDGRTAYNRPIMPPRSYDPQQFEMLTAHNPVRRRWHLNKLRLFQLVEIAPGGRVFDAGCGIGSLVFKVSPLCRLAIGCDRDLPFLTYGARKGRGGYVQADLQRLPFADESFRVIFCQEVLEHLERGVTLQVLEEFYRVLASNGQLLVTTPNYRSLWVLIEFLADTLGLAPDVAGGEHISHYHRRTLAETLTTAGFTITKLGTFNHFSPFVAVLSDRWAERLSRWERKAGRGGGHLLYALCQKP